MGDFSILSKRIKELRKNLDMTQRQFAEKVGCTSATLSAYENGAKSPSLEIVKNIAEKCEVSLDWLCGLTDNQKGQKKTYSTYSDILKTLLELGKVCSFSIEPLGDTPFDQKTPDTIVFDSLVLRHYLTLMAKYQGMLDDGLIDNDIYQACIEKLLRDSSVEIDKTEGKNIYDEDLPFDES